MDPTTPKGRIKPAHKDSHPTDQTRQPVPETLDRIIDATNAYHAEHGYLSEQFQDI